MKKVLISLLICSSIIAKADEGMWIPSLLKELNIDDMKAKGLNLSADDIYNINKSSMKDAIISFGGFCTGEVISDQGLVLTNHHCGYGQIQSHSSVENDYLTNGFWAMKKEEELSNPGLTATFIRRIDDVTTQVLEGVTSEMVESKRQEIVAKNIKKITTETTKDNSYGAKIKSMFYGNKYFMFITETFKDVRMVGAPPSAIGKFGGDTDNWMWPRHTGDFSMFRIYADKDNNPAEYSKENVPYTPKHHLPISLKGIDKGDFTMVFGFPGRTQEYLTSYAVENIMNVSNPTKISLREQRLKMMKRDMRESDEVRIKYSAKYARVSNYHKKWIGENRGLKRLDAINTKKSREVEFQKWAFDKPEYKSLFNDFEKVYKDLNKMILAQDYLYEAGFAMEIFVLAYRFEALTAYAKSPDFKEDRWNKMVEGLKSRVEKHFKDYNVATDKAIAPIMLKMYDKGVPTQYKPSLFDEINKKYKGDYEKYIATVFKKSKLTTKESVDKIISSLNQKSIAKVEKDLAYKMMINILGTFRKKVAPQKSELDNKVDLLNRTYLKAMMEMNATKKFYPDANSTLRIAYGKVDDYKPKDGANYRHYTTLSGIIDKGQQDVEDYVVPPKLDELYSKKDFGQYADEKGYLPVCFTASNHTTGGNSGSPVIDADGNLIGLNFDRNWEGTMSDIMYDPDRCRNIAVDARYVLFIVDKFAEASHLVNEMTLIK